MRTIAFINPVRTTGKTTCCLNIGAGLTILGKRVLLIDLDRQMPYNLTFQSNVVFAKGWEQETIYDVLKGTASLSQAAIPIEGDRIGDLSIVPTRDDLIFIDTDFRKAHDSEFLLKRALESESGYDFILIDTPPSLGLATLNALVGAKELLFIEVPGSFDLRFNYTKQVMSVIEEVKNNYNRDLTLTGVIPNLTNNRSSSSREGLIQMKEFFGESLVFTSIRGTDLFEKSPEREQIVFEKECPGAVWNDFISVCWGIIKSSNTSR